jgi:hypothetical protein
MNILSDLLLRLKVVEVYKLTSILRQALDRLGEQSPRAYVMSEASQPNIQPVLTTFSSN